MEIWILDLMSSGRNLGGRRMWITKRSIFKEILELKIIL